MSVNDCITLHNSSSMTTESSSCSLPPLSEAQVLAHTLNSLEIFLDTYQKTEMEELEQLYYKYWLHR
jgi:biotin-(acetyl-CoA carboxylase) ligase